MKKSKVLILLITLTFPVILYLFLRSYGENEFALPIFFDKEEKLLCTDSTESSSAVQVIDVVQQDTLIIQNIYQAEYKVIHIPKLEDPEIQKLKNELNRIVNTFNDLSINLVSLVPYSPEQERSNGFNSFLEVERSSTYIYSEENRNEIVNCVYAFPTSEWDGKHPSEETIAIGSTLVLLDEKNRIRGYYDGYETKEVDRLILEIRVLLSNR